MNERSAVGVVGEGPAVEAVLAALGDGPVVPRAIDSTADNSVDLAVVVASADDDRFDETNRRREGSWIAVELGGIGGVAVDGLDASLAYLDGGGPCYDCLRLRVRSTTEDRTSVPTSTSRRATRLAGAHAGHLALEALDGSVPVGTVLELPHTERRLLAVPDCACETPGSHELDREHAAVDLESTLARAERAVDPRLGPVQSIGEAESFPVPYYLATLADTAGFSDGRAARHAAGVAADWNPAFVKAVGEALERYSAGVYRTASFEVTPATALGDAIAPGRFVRPESEDDHPAADAPVAWVAGEALHTGETVHLPAERVQFPPPAERTGPAITTGLGLGTSGVGALVSGLTEVIERDATMIAWYSTFEPLALSVDDPTFEVVARRARSEGLAVTPLLVTQDIDVPVVTVAVHREDWPRFAVGSAAGLDPVGAARSALEEALQNWMELRGMGPDGAADEEPTLARYADLPPEARSLIAVDELVPATSVGPAEPPAGPAALDALLERLAAVDLPAYAARLTPPDVDALGFEAVRVLVPSAQPLFTGERFFGDRARSVPRKLGYRPRLDRPPHPYP